MFATARAARLVACVACVVLLGACASARRSVVIAADPADTSGTFVAPPDSGPVRVAVVPLRAEGLTEPEEELVTQLIAIRLERDGYVVVTTPPSEDGVDPCVDPVCLASVASLVHADVTIAASYARLGDADVITLLAWDVAGRRLVRDVLSAQQRGALPDQMGGTVDSLMARVLAALPPLRRPDLKQKYDALRLDVCEDVRGWWFCDARHVPLTENEVVRRYQSETRRHDLDDAQVDRELDLEPWIWIGAGGVTGLASLVVSMFVIATPQGQTIATATDDAWIVVPALGGSAALALLVYGIIALSDSSHMDDGTELDHTMDEAAARAAVSRYNAALLERIAREAKDAIAQPG